MILPDEATHAVDIFAFIRAEQIPAHYYEKRYCLAPAPGDDKLYAVLLDALSHAKKIGIAHVWIGTKQHLGALVPCGTVLALNTLRWCGSDAVAAARIDGINLPETLDRIAGLPARETDPNPCTTARHERRDRKPRARSRRPMT